jgi:hypothetical protein
MSGRSSSRPEITSSRKGAEAQEGTFPPKLWDLGWGALGIYFSKIYSGHLENPHRPELDRTVGLLRIAVPISKSSNGVLHCENDVLGRLELAGLAGPHGVRHRDPRGPCQRLEKSKIDQETFRPIFSICPPVAADPGRGGGSHQVSIFGSCASLQSWTSLSLETLLLVGAYGVDTPATPVTGPVPLRGPTPA